MPLTCSEPSAAAPSVDVGNALQRIADRNGGNRAAIPPATTTTSVTWPARCAVVSNNIDGDVPVNGTLGSPEEARIPTAGLSQNDGNALAGSTGEPATLDLRYHLESRTSHNVIAQTRTGRSVNDNGTGSGGLLEIALSLGSSPRITNAMRFAWWGPKELGLLGSTAYVDQLIPEQQLDIALYLNEGIKTADQAAKWRAGRRGGLRPVLPPGLRHAGQPEPDRAGPDE